MGTSACSRSSSTAARIPENFRLPYLARGPADFWKRWHITLSTWLRDYLYISVGGSRGSRLRTYRNLMLTMLLGGLWHGAAWGFVLWGAYHGVWLAVHRALCRDRRLLRMPGWLSVLLTFHGVCIGWVLFRAQSLADVAIVLRQLLDFSLPLFGLEPIVALALATGFASHFLGASESLRASWNARAADLRGLTYAAIAVGVYLLGAEGNQFIYFQF